MDTAASASHDASVAGSGVRGSRELLAEARSRIERFAPAAAWAASRAGDALVVDIRSEDERRRDGIVPGSVHVPRTVLEWRADPQSEWCNPHIAARERRLVLICSHGWSSSLAAATLVELGFVRAADVDGGFEAWVAAGLPTAAAPERAAGTLPGMSGPDRPDGPGALPSRRPASRID